MLRHILLGVGCMLLLAPLPKESEVVGFRKEAAFVSRLVVTRDVHLDNGNQYQEDSTGTAFPYKVEKMKDKNKVFLLTAAHNVNSEVGQVIDNLEIEFFAKKMSNHWVISPIVTFTLENVKILKKDVMLDYAILTGTTTHYVCSSRLSTKAPKYLQRTYTVGCPIGIPPVITEGIVTRESSEMPGRWLNSSQVIYGNSGGPVYDKETGEVIGITTSLLIVNNGWSTIPITHLHLFLPISSVKI